ncbi:MAG: 50S ribosomal protein L13 [Bacilli bacterium]|jgi:large subunit ribosomal protein L13|nr:50S ribosomal protein L13 [Bacilli bacterium]
MQRQTTIYKKNDVTKNWYIVDASDKPLGRLASEIAIILMGKNKPEYTPNFDCGDYVIVVNCSKVWLTGDKIHKKMYFDNKSGTYGGLRTREAKVMKKVYPTEMVRRAVWGMLPKGSLGRQMVRKLYVYADANHDKQDKKPIEVELTAKREK